MDGWMDPYIYIYISTPPPPPPPVFSKTERGLRGVVFLLFQREAFGAEESTKPPPSQADTHPRGASEEEGSTETREGRERDETDTDTDTHRSS